MRVLQTIWDGGGNTAPQLAIARALVGRGHDVVVLGHACQRERVDAAGARFAAWRHAPDGDASSPDTDLLSDWEAKTPVGGFARVRDRLMYGPAALFARDVLDTLESEPADVVAWDYLLLGAGAAAERAGVPSAAVVHTVYPFPAESVPPFGLGLLPSHGAAGRVRDAVLARVLLRSFAPGLKALNAARTALGLPRHDTPFDQVLGADRVLVLTVPELDFASAAPLPANVGYVGAVLDRARATGWASPWRPDDGRPLVLASLSTTFMDQHDLAQRIADALGALPARGLITTGPAIEGDRLRVPQNVAVAAFVPHAAVLPEASLAISHAGMGTVHAALAAGTPLLCLPGGRDQNDVAARVVHAGAGLRAGQGASAAKLRRLVERALGDPALARAARDLAAPLRARDGAAGAADAIEALAG